MRSKPFSLLMLTAIFTLALPLGSALRAQEVDGQRTSSRLQAERVTIDPELTLVKGVRGGPLAQRTGPVKVVIELTDAPTTRVYADAVARGNVSRATVDAQRQLSTIDQAQKTLVNELQSTRINASIIYRTQRVYNGIAATVDRSKLVEIARLPGVKAIRRLVTKTVDNSSSVPLIGAPQVWASAGGNGTGEGISIGVIDTGIDYLHTDFGGPGTATAYDANDTTVISDGSFPTAKVVGGYDFAGDEYDASAPATSTPAPDPDPMDCNGHGSHVAGTAAGYGVNANGTTYAGPWNTSTPFSSLRIGPGVAPKAELYALRVFGCGGSTDLTDQAIEWAVDPNGDGNFADRLDVINMSLGSDYGSAYDSTSVASDNAAAVGVVVVASAGNSGDTYYIGGSPGSASRVIGVASSVDSTDTFDGFRVNAPPAIAGVKPGSESANFNWAGKAPVTGAVVYPPDQRSGCQAFSTSNAALLAGKIALLDWTTIGDQNECGSAARVNNAANAGAIGVILVYNQPELDIAIAGSARIPSIITLQSVGAQLKANLTGLNVTLSPEFRNSTKVVDQNKVDTLSSFSSRGPRRADSALKPDIAAPGQSIFSVEALSGNNGTSLNGTSMAAPHVAGAMALLRQQHPDWTVEELKALAMNTANQPVRAEVAANSTKYGPQRVGAGRIKLTDANAANVVAYNADDQGQVSVSFGAVEVIDTKTAVKNIRVVNKGSSAVAYALSYEPATDIPGVSFSLSASNINVPAGGSVNVAVTMTANAAQMTHTSDPTITRSQGGGDRQWLSEESGRVIMTPSSGVPLRVPVYAAARAASDMRSAKTTLTFGTNPTGASTIPLTGKGVGSAAALDTATPEDEVSIVTAFELQNSSPNDPESETLADSADLKYVGVASDAKSAASFAETQLAFGVATYGNWSSPNEVEFDIYIDTNRDGEDDYVLFNWNLSSATGGTDASDVFITYLLNLNDSSVDPVVGYLNGFPSSAVNTALFNSSVMMLPVTAGDLGLSAANATFNYTVVSFGLGTEGNVDITPTLTYNAAKPGLDLSDGVAGVPAYVDLPNASIPVDFTQADYSLARSQGVLLLHHLNTTGRQSEVVAISALGSNRLFLPFIPNR